MGQSACSPLLTSMASFNQIRKNKDQIGVLPYVFNLTEHFRKVKNKLSYSKVSL